MRHSLFLFLTAIAYSLAPGVPVVAEGPDAQQLLERADQFRARWPSVVTHVRIDNYDAERLQESEEFEVSIKGESSYVRFLSVRNKGHALLMRGDDMWYFLPSASRPVRITPIQRLLGNASNGDLARLRYDIDYTAALGGEDAVDGTRCTVLDLRAKRRGATYQRIRYAVAASDARPIRAECFLASGKLVKRAYFGELKPMAGHNVLTRIVIFDELKPAARTVMDFLSFAPRDLPDKLFNPVRADGM